MNFISMTDSDFHLLFEQKLEPRMTVADKDYFYAFKMNMSINFTQISTPHVFEYINS
jgi:hypothetical protein